MKYFLSLLALLACLTSQVALAQTPSTTMADQMKVMEEFMLLLPCY